MARKIIILEADSAGQGEVGFRYALWADVPPARQVRYANASFVSAVAGATGAEVTALQTGAVTERVGSARWQQGTTIPQVQGFLIAAFNTFQAEISAANPWQRYGTSWDGSSWTPVNNV